MKVGNDGEVDSRVCGGAPGGEPPRRLMHDRRALPRRPCRRIMRCLLLLLARHVLLHARALRQRRLADRVTAQSADGARHRRPCAALGTGAGRAFRFGGMTAEATALLDATVTTAAASFTGDGGHGHCNAAARVWLLLMKLVDGDRAHGHTAEPVVDVFAPQLDLSAPRPPTDHRQAAQQPNNRREHGDGEDADGAATGAVQRAWGRTLRGREWRERRR